jgi:hypothetical protein
MKTIFTLLLSTVFSLSSMAYDGTLLTVASVSNQQIFVEVDGKRYNYSGNSVAIRNIRPGTHHVRVFRELKRNKGRVIDIWAKREEVIYSIKATLKNGYHFDILVNRFGKVMIDERRIDQEDEWFNEEDDNYGDDRDRDYDNGRDEKDWDNESDDRNDDVYDNGDDKRDNRDPRDDDRYSRNMSDYDFSMAKESLRKEWHENTRMTAAKQIVDKNYFSSQQVKDLLLLFTFENNRLELAKYAYGRTVDKQNYHVVNDAFTFNSNKEKLSGYIREYE